MVPVGIGFNSSVYCSPCKTLAKSIESPGTPSATKITNPPNAGITPKLDIAEKLGSFSYNRLKLLFFTKSAPMLKLYNMRS